MKMVLLAIGLVALSVVLLGVKVLFVKGGSFPSGHVHDLPQLKRKKQKEITTNRNEKDYISSLRHSDHAARQQLLRQRRCQ